MSQSKFFSKLGAKLQNVRWSWGAVREKDGAVFLRVWQDTVKQHNGKLIVRVTSHEKFEEDLENAGYVERLKHLDLVRSGNKCYLVMCQAVDENAVPRKVREYNKEEVFQGGGVVELEGDTWLELGKRFPINQVMLSA